MNHPNLSQIIQSHELLKDQVLKTSTLEDESIAKELVASPSHIFLKLEHLQKTGSFKIRGALNVMKSLSKDQLSYGVVTFSGGNHAIAVSYAAQLLGTSAKVVMPSSTNTAKIDLCKNFGAKVVLAKTRAESPTKAMEIKKDENRFLVPPFEHPKTVEGTATLGYEFLKQIPALDVIFVPIGGGGLAAGVSCAVKQMKPTCQVIGVQPITADAMSRSFQTGKAELNEHVDTVAESLCPPQVGQYTFEVCKKFVDEIQIVEEPQIKKAMRLLFHRHNFIVEGAGAVALAGAMNSKGGALRGKNVGILVSGSNIDLLSFENQLK